MLSILLRQTTLALLVLLATPSHAVTTFCTTSNSFCIVSASPSQLPSSSFQGTCFTVHSAATGWAAFGIGSAMANADVFVGWKNSTNGFTIANLQSSGEFQPQLDPTIQNVFGVPLIDKSMSLGLDFSFCRPTTVKGGAPAITSGSSYIYAYSSNPPSTPDSPSSIFNIHSDKGSFSVNFVAASNVNQTVTAPVGAGPGGLTPILTLASGTSYQTIIDIHAAAMWLAWVMCPMAGIFFARYGKSRLGHLWYKLHMAIMGLGTVLCSLGGGILIFLYHTPPHFNSNHGLIGVIILGSMFLQVILGFVSNHLFDVNRTKIPLVDKAHWWFGRLLYAGALVNVQLGFMLYQSFSYVLSPIVVYAHYGIIGLGFILFCVAEFSLGQDNHVGKKDDDDTERNASSDNLRGRANNSNNNGDYESNQSKNNRQGKGRGGSREKRNYIQN